MEKGYYLWFKKSSVPILVVAIHNKNGKGLLHIYHIYNTAASDLVAIHNKNGKGLLHVMDWDSTNINIVAIHNKNGKGLLPEITVLQQYLMNQSQSTIKMEKGYY